jgi:hypothetical protein
MEGYRAISDKFTWHLLRRIISVQDFESAAAAQTFANRDTNRWASSFSLISKWYSCNTNVYRKVMLPCFLSEIIVLITVIKKLTYILATCFKNFRSFIQNVTTLPKHFPHVCVDAECQSHVTLCWSVGALHARCLNPFRFYVESRPTLWFSCSRRFSWSLTISNPIFLPPAYSPVLIYFGRERGWWVSCNYPTVLKEKIRNRKSTTCAICWLKSVVHEDEVRHNDFPVPDAFPHVVRNLANR